MTRALLAAAAIGTLVGLALTFGPHGAVGIAVCAAGVIAWFGVQAARRDEARRYREQVWQRRDIAYRLDLPPDFDRIEAEWWLSADLKPWPIGDDEVRS